MYKLGVLVLLVWFALFAVVNAFPLLENDFATYHDVIAPLRVAREAFADPRRFHRPGFGGFGGGGFGNSGASANSYSAGFNTPFGGFQTSGSNANSFGGGGGFYG